MLVTMLVRSKLAMLVAHASWRALLVALLVAMLVRGAMLVVPC
jgi:hypothetical protein